MVKKKKKTKSKSPETIAKEQKENDRQELIERVKTLQRECLEENETKTSFEERLEKINIFWEIEKKTLEDKKLQIQKQNDELDVLQINHKQDIAKRKGLIKRILSRNEIKVNEKKSDAEVENHFLKTQHWAKENDLECDRLRVCKYIKELESSFKDVLIELEQEKTGSLTIAREDFRISYNELSSYSEKKLKTWNKQIESLIKDDITFLERKNDSQIKDLKIAHDQELDKIRNTCNEKYQLKLDEIDKLKTRNLQLKKKQRRNEKMLAELKEKNTSIVEPFSQAKDGIVQLEQEYKIFQKESEELRYKGIELRNIKDKLKDVEWRHEVLFQRNQALILKRDHTLEQLELKKLDAQQCSNYKCLLLENKLKNLSNLDEQYLATQVEMLARTNVQVESVSCASQNNSLHDITNVIDEKNKLIEEMEEKIKYIKGIKK